MYLNKQCKPFIKICGIKDAKTAVNAIQFGAYFIGLVFHPASKRYVTMAQAKLIADAVNNSGGKCVAVFVNHDAKEMQMICEQLAIDIVQLHGDIAREEHHSLPEHIKRIYVHSPNLIGLNKCIAQRDFILFDNSQAGSGKTFEWKDFKYDGNLRLGIAGGLNANNITDAIKRFDPQLIDVSSGVENASGEKSIQLIKEFIREVMTNAGK